MDKVDVSCHYLVQLSRELVLVMKKDKPLVRTMKGSVARILSLKIYEEEIDDLYRSIV